jgi:hypothetical protein
MAKIKANATSTHIKQPKIKRPGVHAKSKTSTTKNSKNYVKPYVAQGR